MYIRWIYLPQRRRTTQRQATEPRSLKTRWTPSWPMHSQRTYRATVGGSGQHSVPGTGHSSEIEASNDG